jgi:probable H4MPT-linked C1 transfer pathway protein
VPPDSLKTIGWDIGGANIKAVALCRRKEGPLESRVAVLPFEIWRERKNLPAALAEIGNALGAPETNAMAVTMTAELSDTFRTKREGVLSVFDAMARAFPQTPIHPMSLAGDFVELGEARLRPLDFAASNWVASALYVAGRYPTCILLDVGSTTADIVPVRDGRIVSRGITDTERLTSGELVYSGILRTNPNTIAGEVPIDGRMCRVAAEYFTVMADVYLILGFITAEAYTCPTPDGRAATPGAARERLARLVCADAEMLNEEQTLKLARYLFEKQLQQLSGALCQVLSGLENGYQMQLAVAGAGTFLAAEAGRRLGITILDLGRELGEEAVTALPAMAAAYLLAQKIDGADS